MFAELVMLDPETAFRKIAEVAELHRTVGPLQKQATGGILDTLKGYAGQAGSAISGGLSRIGEGLKAGDPLTTAGVGAAAAGGASLVAEGLKPRGRRRWSNAIAAAGLGGGLGAIAPSVMQTLPAVAGPPDPTPKEPLLSRVERGVRNTVIPAAQTAEMTGNTLDNAGQTAAQAVSHAGDVLGKHVPAAKPVLDAVAPVASSAADNLAGTAVGAAGSLALRKLPQGGNLMRGWDAISNQAGNTLSGDLKLPGLSPATAGVPAEDAFRGAMGNLGRTSFPGFNRWDTELAARHGIPAAGHFTAKDRIGSLLGRGVSSPLVGNKSTVNTLLSKGTPRLGAASLWPMGIGAAMDGMRYIRKNMAQPTPGAP